jgi:hypothetical protein
MNNKKIIVIDTPLKGAHVLASNSITRAIMHVPPTSGLTIDITKYIFIYGFDPGASVRNKKIFPSRTDFVLPAFELCRFQSLLACSEILSQCAIYVVWFKNFAYLSR